MTMLREALEQQQRKARAAPSSANERIAKLKTLRHQLERYQDLFADAANADFGGRPQFESRLIEVVGTLWVLDHAIRNLRSWIKPEKRGPQALFAGPNTLTVTYQPKGVVGIITPWNMPLYLSIGPLVAALAAGNRAMIKLPDETPQSNSVIKKLLGEIFPEDEVAVFGAEITDPSEFTALPFDHMIFTGSQRVGRLVMAAAAQNLVPVTLELGGKSPALVAQDYPIEDAALRITHGKIAMSGQICVAPDYALIPKDRIDNFVKLVKQNFTRFYPDGAEARPEYCSLVNDHHAGRIKAMLADAEQKGATIVACAPWNGGNRIPLHVVTGLTPDMRIAQEEVFGPILPVVAYESLDQAITYIADQPHPLALYLFSTNSDVRDRVLGETRSGGVTINDWGWHVVNAAVPFGGVGNSGFGSYHGVEGFRELSNPRPIFQRATFFPTQLMYPPINTGARGIFQRFWMNVYSKKADPTLKGTPYGEPMGAPRE
ncbi:coniferyl aldehyde dehydrogenase [Congregibacter sp.]|nr:coniferyl aldehyde dehydrogenase [Congregibacter sp.]MDA8962003.1 coniferyl aldehyde dehydrogenase [Congregibacter sp.]